MRTTLQKTWLEEIEKATERAIAISSQYLREAPDATNRAVVAKMHLVHALTQVRAEIEGGA